MILTDFSNDECDKYNKDLLTESETDIVVEDVDRTVTLKMQEKLKVFPLSSNNQFVYVGSHHAEQKYKTLPVTVNVHVTKTAKEFPKRFKVGKKYMNVLDLKAKENMKGQKPKRK